jgi:hypothetical protein
MLFDQIKSIQTLLIVLFLSTLSYISSQGLSSDQQRQLDRELKKNPNMMKHFCEEEFPYASVGDFNITSYNLFRK